MVFKEPLTEEQELSAIKAISGVVALELNLSPSLVKVRRATSRRLHTESVMSRHLGAELRLVVEVSQASVASLSFLVSDSGRAVLTKQITVEVARRGLPSLLRSSIQQAVPVKLSDPSLGPGPGAHQAAGDASGSSGVAVVVSVLLSLAVLGGMLVASIRYRRKWLKKKATAHRSVEKASLKQGTVNEDSSDSDPGSPQAQRDLLAGSGRLSMLLQILPRLVPFSPARTKHRRLKPDDGEVCADSLQSPSGQTKVSQTPQQKLGFAVTVECSRCGCFFSEQEKFCTKCGALRPADAAIVEASCRDDVSSEGGSTRPPTAGSQSTMASAMSALRGLAQHVEWTEAPELVPPQELVSASTDRGVKEVGHRAAPSTAGVSWSAVTEFGAEQAPAQVRVPAWPPPAGVEVHGSDGALGAPRHLAAAAEQRRQVAPPPRRRVLPEGAPAPPVPPPRLRRDQDGGTNAGGSHHPH